MLLIYQVISNVVFVKSFKLIKMFINKLRISNFRSIVKSDILLKNLSIFVGFNDVGKSNVLKALNLFFNGETDYETPLNFSDDYSKYAPLRKNKAEEIKVEIIINAPKNYIGSKDIKWTKVWRRTGLYLEEIVFVDGTNFPKKSKLYSWLKNLRFTYIPAIRGTLYFQIMLAKLHDTLAETIESELRLAGDDFIRKIKTNTEGMIKEISKRIDIESQIRFPSNLQTLFKTLDFATSDGVHNISLSNRGDGVKTRHIPAILKFISHQLNVNKVKGSPNVNMIWGYEEPENNLEMLATYSLAGQFFDYSSEIQILLTTHSPGFYSLKSKHDEEISLYKVVKPKLFEAQILPLSPQHDLDEDMGIMPLISPYIEEKIHEIECLNDNIASYKAELGKIDSNVIYVEGEEEVTIFSKIMEELNLSSKIIVSNKGLGCSGVKNQLMAHSWVSGISKYKAAGIFDYDDSGRREFSKLKAELQYKDASTKKKVKGFSYNLKLPTHLVNIKTKMHEFPIELEEMYPVSVWKIAEEQGWLELRDINELSNFVKLDSLDQTLSNKIEKFGFSEDEKLYVYYKIPDKHKEKASNFVIETSDSYPIKDRLEPLFDFFKVIYSFIDS